MQILAATATHVTIISKRSAHGHNIVAKARHQRRTLITFSASRSHRHCHSNQTDEYTLA